MPPHTPTPLSDKTIREGELEMNKTGLAALVALVGAGLITTKNFKSSFASETFMAQGKRAIALRDNRINQEDLKWKNYTIWHDRRNEIFTDKGSNIPSQELHSLFYTPLFSGMGYRHYTTYCVVLNDMDKAYRTAFASIYKNQIKIVSGILFRAVSNLKDSITEIEKKNGGSISQTDFLNTNEGTKAIEDFKEAVLKMKQVLPKFRTETYNFSLVRISEDTSLKSILQTITGRTYGEVHIFHLNRVIEGMERNPSYIYAQSLINSHYALRDEMIANKQEITDLRNWMVTSNYVSLYAYILGYNQFFKANPQIKSIAEKEDEKYYSVRFGRDKDEVPAPKGADRSALVWDTDLFSQFNQAEFDDLVEDSAQRLTTKIEDMEKENIRKGGKKGRMENRIKSDQDDMLKKELEAVFSNYGPNLDNNQKNELLGTYLSDILNLPVQIGNRFRFQIHNFPVVGRENGEPQIQKQVIYSHNAVIMVNERGIEISVPASLKADAKQEFENTMNARIEGQQRSIAQAQANIKTAQDTLQEGLKRF
jgi:hypothetical protein